MRRFWALTALFLGLWMVVLGVFFYTPVGTAVLGRLLPAVAGDYISYSSLKGTIAQELEVEDLKLNLPALDIGVERIALSWQGAWLLGGTVVVDGLEVEELLFSFKASGAQDEQKAQASDDTPFILPLPTKLSPINIDIHSLNVQGIGFISPSGEMVEHIDQVELSGSVQGYDLTIKKLIVEDKDYGISLVGSAITGEEWQADIGGDWRFSNWDGAELHGSLAAKGPLPNMDADVQLFQPARVDIKGKMTGLPGNPHFDVVGVGQYTDISVIYPGVPDIYLNALVHARGTIMDYKATLKTIGDYWRYKGIVAEGNLWGNWDELHFPLVTFTHGQTTVRVENAYMDWVEKYILGGKVYPQNFNPGIIDPRFEGRLTGEIDGLLTVEYGEDGDLYGWYSLRDMKGTLRGYPVSGSLDLNFTDKSLSFDHIELVSGKSTLHYQASFDDELAMSLSLNSNNIGEFLPESAGVLHLDAKLAGSYDAPLLEGKVSGQDIKISDVFLGRISGALSTDTNRQAKKAHDSYQLSISGIDMSILGEDVEQGTLEVHGSLAKHGGAIVLTSPGKGEDAELAFTGSLEEAKWLATIEKFKLNHGVYGRWTQEDDAQIFWDEHHIQLDQFFIKSDSARLYLGAHYEFDEDGNFRLEGALEDYPLGRFGQIVAADSPFSRFTGSLNSRFLLSGTNKKLEDAQVQMEAENFTLLLPEKEGEIERIAAEKIQTLALFNGKRAEVKIAGDLNGSEIIGDFSSPWDGVWNVELKDLPLSGTGSIKNLRLDSLAALTDYKVESRGVVQADIALAGHLASPRLDAKLVLVEGDFFLPEQGVAVKDAQILLQAENGQMTVDGSLLSGGGKLLILGDISNHSEASEGLAGVLRLTGDNVLLMDTPEYIFYASPDLTLRFNDKNASLTGDLLVSKARISSAKAVVRDDSRGDDRGKTHTIVMESDDVTIIDAAGDEKVSAYSIKTNIDLFLGQDVRLDRFGIKGRLEGRLNVQDSKQSPLRGKGSIAIVDGLFAAYGRSFELSRGTISYDGGALANPGLDIRVQKEIRVHKGGGQGSMATVGLDVSGYASNLNYTLFSSPYMDDADTLSYLLFGHSLLSASGAESNVLAEVASTFGWQTGANLISGIASVLPIDDVHLESGVYDRGYSLVVGKNITKDLYIGYDYNVLDQLGEILLRYDLNYGFYIESTTSSESTGADILYILEK